MKSAIPDKNWRDPVTGLTLKEMEERMKARRDRMLREAFTEKREEEEKPAPQKSPDDWMMLKQAVDEMNRRAAKTMYVSPGSIKFVNSKKP